MEKEGDSMETRKKLDTTQEEKTKEEQQNTSQPQTAPSDHSWVGTWERPITIDEQSFDPLTVARMTDHNVRGSDQNTDTSDESTEIDESEEEANVEQIKKRSAS
jgi:hypothetical protein